MRRIALAIAAVGWAWTGCAEKTQEVVVLRPEVPWEDLSAGPVNRPSDGYARLAGAGTQGLFPTSIAVARVTLADVTRLGDGGLVLDMEPSNEFLPWNSLFDGLFYVRDTFPLDQKDLSGGEAVPPVIVDAARTLGANLCLIYAAGDASETETRIKGILYDTRTGTHLAAVEKGIRSPDQEAVPHPPELAEDDMRHVDARYQAASAFRSLVFDCVRDLKSHDRSVPPARDEGWVPDAPVEPWPRAWPPPDFTRRPYGSGS